MRRDPEGQPVVAEVENGIRTVGCQQRPVPHRRHQAVAGNEHSRIRIGMLPAGLIRPRGGDQLHRFASMGQLGSFGRHEGQMMPLLRQPPQQRAERQLNTPAAATAEGTDGCADQHQIQPG